MEEDGKLLSDYSRRGDPASLSALVVRNSRWMTAFLRGMLGSLPDAEDVFQETWLRVIRSRGAYRGGSPKAYLTKIARSAALDFLRRKGKYVLSIDDDDGSRDDPGCTRTAPDEAFEIKATVEEVQKAVAALRMPEREVVLMRVEGELTFKEIAAQLDLPLGTVLTRMRTATIRLRNELKEGSDE